MRDIGPKIGWSAVTPRADWVNRRQLIAAAGAAAAGAALPATGQDWGAQFDGDREPNSFEDITSYNNFYEFGLDKGDPKRNSGDFRPTPWTIVIDGLVERPGTYDLADIVKDKAIEERIYRFRCVEAWSMVIPWNGFELNALLAQAGVQPGAKYVAFETVVRPEEMPGQRLPLLDWPYVEGLRIDEAMHPLTLMATGLYGQDLLNQSGAPIRLVVPWKYGFKSIKSIVRITLTEAEPPTTWNRQAPNEYGFFANVNPEVSHPRWSQASERRVGGGLFAPRYPTLMFNGYADQVAGLYTGMDLRAQF